MDEVVQGRRAPVIIHLRMSSILVRQERRPFPSLADLPHPNPRLFYIPLRPLCLPRYVQLSAISSTYRAGQVASYGLLLHQLESDVDVKLAAILDILVAAQGMFTGGVGDKTISAWGTQWGERCIL